MFVSGDPIDSKYIFLLEESKKDSRFDFWLFLSECENRANQNAVNAFIVPFDLIVFPIE
jgi:hypothetical protein